MFKLVSLFSSIFFICYIKEIKSNEKQNDQTYKQLLGEEDPMKIRGIESTSTLFNKINTLKSDCQKILNTTLPNINSEIQKEFAEKTEEMLNDLKNTLKTMELALKNEMSEYLDNANTMLDNNLRTVISTHLAEAIDIIKKANIDEKKLFENIDDEDGTILENINREGQDLLKRLLEIINSFSEKEKKFLDEKIKDSVTETEDEIKKIVPNKNEKLFEVDSGDLTENVDEYLENNKNELYFNIKKEVADTIPKIIKLINESGLKNRENLLNEFNDPSKNYIANLDSIFKNTVNDIKDGVDKYAKEKIEKVNEIIKNKMNEYEKYAQKKIDELNTECSRILEKP
ncbi:hypothetical protein SLOPH_732 [Spraguea lophii 42_110]|uniref:Reticulocyte binding protein n=1 Tax=Spraguea lophii (strain 42_110) TaxID=1358809 RepID=S7XKI8_SPRLO|nr:hypothetical protein SLOPH_732 [Spraguea lophii 42_110]